VLVRYFAEKLKPLSGRTVIVENKPGAGGNIATEYMVRSKPDGHTIFIHAGNTLASNFHLIKNNPVDARKQVQIAATINKQAFMLMVDAKKPWKDVRELTAAMKAKGPKATYAYAANSGKIMGAIYKERAGLEAQEVSYRMAQDSLNDMLSGAVDFAAHDPVYALSEHRKGTLRILAVASAQRLKAAPEFPTMTELGYAMDLVGWFSAMVPAATPRPIVDQINKWMNTILAEDETQKFLMKFGGDPWISTPDEGQARMLKDIEDWVEFVRIAKLTPS
jgi:tripartite-type tricarboxylate transporter receptor subunit TctC